MNKKITFPELVDALSESNGISKKVNESLLKDFFALIQDTLERGETVKIKKLGVFKVVKVEARKSINVNTGKEIEIPEHLKVSFAPDKELANEVNAAFADFETIELDDNISEEDINSGIEDFVHSNNLSAPSFPQKESEEPLEGESGIIEAGKDKSTNITEIPSNKSSDSSSRDNNDENIKGACENETADDTNNAESANDIKMTDNPQSIQSEIPDNLKPNQEEGNVIIIKSEPNSTEENNTDTTEIKCIPENDDETGTPDNSSNYESSQVYHEDDSEKTNDNYDDSNYNEYEEHKHHKTKFFKGFFIGVLCTIIIIAILIYALSHLGVIKITDNNEDTTIISDNKIEISSETAGNNISNEESSNGVKEEECIINVEETESDNDIVYETIKENITLAKLARKHYGHTAFWIYIYEENKDKIKDPDQIALGTVIVIPPKSKYNINKDNPESISLAKKQVSKFSKKNK